MTRATGASSDARYFAADLARPPDLFEPVVPIPERARAGAGEKPTPARR